MLHRHPVLSLLTGGYLAFVAWVTLTPQSYASAHIAILYRALDALHRRGYLLSIDDAELELLANVALFVPVGMFLLLLLGTRFWWAALATAFALTAFIETAQRSIPGRVPDEQDIMANGLGAVIGVLLAVVLTLPDAWRRRRRRLVGSEDPSLRKAERPAAVWAEVDQRPALPERKPHASAIDLRQGTVAVRAHG